MSTYTATIRWTRNPTTDFTKGQYSRAHSWEFDGGLTVPASPSPHIVPAPWNDPNGVDPEEAFVASLSSCHMLFFVDFARRAGFTIDDYLEHPPRAGDLFSVIEIADSSRHIDLGPKLRAYATVGVPQYTQGSTPQL